jgi:hypothetical protein
MYECLASPRCRCRRCGERRVRAEGLYVAGRSCAARRCYTRREGDGGRSESMREQVQDIRHNFEFCWLQPAILFQTPQITS